MNKAVPIILGVAAVGAVIIFALKSKGAGAETEYACPYCSETFGTYEELVTHVQSAHPGERIPLEIDWG